ncbi:cyclic nucleotide-binding-like protein, partial [Catenaria anguillulae PL171]
DVQLAHSKDGEAASRLLKTLVFSVFLSHVDSCMFWILNSNRSKRKWTIATDVIYDEFGDLTPFSERYSRNFYGAQKALYFMPREIITTPEIIFQCVEMLFAPFSKARNFKRSFLIKYMRTNRFPPTLQLKILEQEEFEWIHKRGMDTDRLFLELPKSIREEVNIHLYHGLVSNVPIFKEHAPEVFKVAMCQRYFVCKAGEAGNEMYFLRHGSVEILTPDESRVLVTLGSGSFFGEVALFMPNNRRTATARTTADTELCVLKKEDFDDILRSYPEMIAVFQQEIERRAIANKKRQEEEEAKKKAEEMRKRVASFNLEPGRLRGRQRSHQQSGNSSAFLSRFARQPSASFSASKRGTLGRSIVAQDATPSPQASAPPSPLLRSSTRKSSSFHDAEVDVHQSVGGSAHGVGPRRVSGQHIVDKALGSVASLSSRGGASRSAVQHHVAAVTGSVVASTGIVNGGGNHGQGHEQ